MRFIRLSWINTTIIKKEEKNKLFIINASICITILFHRVLHNDQKFYKVYCLHCIDGYKIKCKYKRIGEKWTLIAIFPRC